MVVEAREIFQFFRQKIYKFLELTEPCLNLGIALCVT